MRRCERESPRYRMDASIGIVQFALSFSVTPPVTWRADWIWGVPLIVLNVVFHALGLGLMNKRVTRALDQMLERRYPVVVFAKVMGAATLWATILHALEAGIWAGAYLFLGALPDYQFAMLYSLSAMTSYGHANLFLENRWQLLGAIEALNGWLLFGLTAAFLFAMIQEVWSRSKNRTKA